MANNYLWNADCGHLYYKDDGREYSLTPGAGDWGTLPTNFVWDVEPFLTETGRLVFEYSNFGIWSGTVSINIDKNAYTDEEMAAFETECGGFYATDTDGGTGGTVASDLGTSTMYFASLGDQTEFNSNSGLIRNGTFNLKWNNFESTAGWNEGTKGRYNSIEDGEVPGTITVVKENVYDNTTTAAYNTFYDLNTGASQTSPTITLIGGSGGKEFSVEYGSVETTALENKYKRYDSGWDNALDGMIDGMVQAAIDGSYQSKAVLNFKKTKVKDFKEETITAFPDQIMVGTTEDPSDEEIMGTDGIMTDAITPTMNDAGAAGGMTENY